MSAEEEELPLTREVRLGQWHEDAGKWTWKPGVWKGTFTIEKIAFEEGSDEKYWMSIGQCAGDPFRKVGAFWRRSILILLFN